jgi:predicted ATP-grasp superfamily ATP-dependent carboligase
MKLDVLLTDGHYKHTYAIIRALVEKKLSVGVLFHKKLSLSFLSRYVTKRFIVSPFIYDDESIYLNEIISILKNNNIKVLLPIGNISNNLVSRFKSEINRYTKVPIVDYEKMNIAQNKSKTFKLAKEINIPIPLTYHINSVHEIEDIKEKISYPAVIKKVNPNESGVIYCNNSMELTTLYKGNAKQLNEKSKLPIIQEYIRGEGVGFYALFNKGKCKAYFMHERLHEYPITGGSSTLAKSSYNEKLKYMGEKILSALNWHGVAMVEFKRDRMGHYYLMEINPKFWGSLELSYKAGLNFPYMVYLLALEKKIPSQSYKKDIYFRWSIPHDLMWMKFSNKKQKDEFKSLKNNVRIHNNLHFDDPLTIIFNLLFLIFKYFTDKKFPHSHIKNELLENC